MTTATVGPPYTRKATRRSLRVFALWANGYSLDAIAERLGMSWETVRRDVAHAKAALGD